MKPGATDMGTFEWWLEQIMHHWPNWDAALTIEYVAVLVLAVSVAAVCPLGAGLVRTCAWKADLPGAKSTFDAALHAPHGQYQIWTQIHFAGNGVECFLVPSRWHVAAKDSPDDKMECGAAVWSGCIVKHRTASNCLLPRRF